jgi:pimeloyl-ACP methyl ester carboxylesterase
MAVTAPGASTATGSTTGGVYPSPAARAEVLALYEAKLAQWPVPFDEFDVATRYGDTHVVAAGDPAAPPLVLVHAAAFPAFMWGGMIAPLSARYRTYALDTIGDIGKSVLDDPRRHPKRGQDYSLWLCDVCDRLGVESPDVVAASMGGWIAMHHAAVAPARVRRLALLVPMGLPSWPATLRVLVRMMTVAALPSRSKNDNLIAWVLGDNPVVRQQVGDWMKAFLEARCRSRVGKPFPVPRPTLRAIQSPVLVLLGGRDNLVGDPRSAARRAKRHLHTAEVTILPDAGHAMPIETPDRVAHRLITFLQ